VIGKEKVRPWCFVADPKAGVPLARFDEATGVTFFSSGAEWPLPPNLDGGGVFCVRCSTTPDDQKCDGCPIIAARVRERYAGLPLLPLLPPAKPRRRRRWRFWRRDNE